MYKHNTYGKQSLPIAIFLIGSIGGKFSVLANFNYNIRTIVRTTTICRRKADIMPTVKSFANLLFNPRCHDIVA